MLCIGRIDGHRSEQRAVRIDFKRSGSDDPAIVGRDQRGLEMIGEAILRKTAPCEQRQDCIQIVRGGTANLFLVLAGVLPNVYAAIAFLLLRSALSQMDVPVRQALVMRLVDPDERAAAASVTNVPRSLGSAATPALAGAMLDWSHFGWPLVFAGVAKATYDLLLLAQPLDRD